MLDFLSTQFNLRQSVLATLAYFDILHFPLTLIELQRYLLKQKAKLDDISEVLEQLVEEGKVEMERGFYFLSQKNSLVENRLRNYSNYVLSYWRIAKRALRILSWIPFVRLIAICNSLAIDYVNYKSDIDLFLVVDRRYLWLTRFLVNFVVGIAGLRERYGKNKAGKICLSFYVTDDCLNLFWVAKKPYDIDLPYLVAQFIPLFDEGIYKRFLGTNLWIKNFLPAYPSAFDRHVDVIGSFWLIKFIKKITETILNLGLGWGLNKFLKLLQLARIKKLAMITPKHYQGKDVVISDKMLKFHFNDRRDYVRSEFEKRLGNLNLL